MRRIVLTLLAGAAVLAPAPAAAQSLAARVAAAPPDATVRFQFQPKPGVCGDGETLMVRGDGSDGMTVIQHGSGSSYTTGSGRVYHDGRLAECREGPVTVELQRAGGRVTSAKASIGATPAADVRELGTVDGREVIEFLLAEETLTAQKRAAERMVFIATLTPYEAWPALLRVAHSTRIEPGVRSSAVFWLAQAAGERATEGLVSIIGDDSDEIEVRKQAVFALSRIGGPESVTQLMRVARTHREPELRRTAMFWLGRSKDPRVLAFFEEILRGR